MGRALGLRTVPPDKAQIPSIPPVTSCLCSPCFLPCFSGSHEDQNRGTSGFPQVGFQSFIALSPSSSYPLSLKFLHDPQVRMGREVFCFALFVLGFFFGGGQGFADSLVCPSHKVQDGFEPLTLPCIPFECWNFRHAMSPLVNVVLGIEPRP